MKKLIASRKEIEKLVDDFYGKIQADEALNFIFIDIAKVNWQKHLPLMYDFFENMLFYTGTYTGNPMEIHKQVNDLFPLTPAHFDRWLQLFNSTVDELFEGEKAILVKQRVKSIAQVMQIKLAGETSNADKIF